MLIIDIKLKNANTGEETVLGRMRISNDGTGSTSHGNYVGEVLRKPEFRAVTRTAGVERFDRKGKVVWVLLARMLKAMGYE